MQAVRTLAGLLILALVFAAGVAVGQQKVSQPKTVLHVVAGQWKADATDEQKQAALDGLQAMAAQVSGVKNIWIKPDRIQPREFNYAFAIEFESRAAADAYAEHPAHEEWNKVYLPIRQQSRSLQITNP